jgi:hypothetical protein
MTSGFWDIVQEADGLPIPDIITFTTGPQWLARPNLYPRQATLLKVIFLRSDLFTDYDRQVIGEWIAAFGATNPNAGGDNKFEAHTNGIQPDIYERIEWLRAHGYRWFKEVILAIGRRGSKGYTCAIAMAYVLYHYLAKGNPQDYYGIMDDKVIQALIFAGKKDQAKANLWGDLNNVITAAPCFTDYISTPQAESLTVFAPHDFARIEAMAARGIRSTKDMASFAVLPKESTLLSSRGPTTAILGFDEAAHVKNSGTSRSFGDVYNAATPSLDQFGADAFICIPSSTWEMTGMFYELWVQSLSAEPDASGAMHGIYANKLMVQLESWAPYIDWERAPELPLFPPDFRGDLGEYSDGNLPRLREMRGPIQSYDDEMRRLERANPDMFAVERRSHWATSLDAYLNPTKVDEIFHPWAERSPRFGPPEISAQQRGIMTMSYRAHGDPSNVGARFGFAIAHKEPDDSGMQHCLGAETRYLTDKGVRTLGETAGTVQNVLTSDHEGGFTGKWVKAEIKSFGVQKLYKVTLQRNKKEKVIYATEGHRWIGRTAGRPASVRSTSGLKRSSPFSLTATFTPGCDAGLTPDEAGIRHGMMTGDGTVYDGYGVLRLFGKKIELSRYFEDLAGYKPRYSSLPSGCPALFMNGIGRLLTRKSPPLQEESDEYLLGWLCGYFATDGNINEQGQARISCADRNILEETRSIAQRIGISCYGISETVRRGLGKENTSLYTIEFIVPTLPGASFFIRSDQRERYEAAWVEKKKKFLQVSWRVRSVEPTDRCEEVFCAVVPGTQAFVLEDNVLTGNCVFDLVKYWDPADYEDHFIDYDEVTDWIFTNGVKPFCPSLLTFDQFNVPATVRVLQKKVRQERLPKQVMVDERVATRDNSWRAYETFKGAVNMGFVHAPFHEEARDELKFLQKKAGAPVVIPPDSGPVVTKDIADCMAIIVYELIGDQMAMLDDTLGGMLPVGAMHTSDTDPMNRFDPGMSAANPYANSLGGMALSRGGRPGPQGQFRPGTVGTRSSQSRMPGRSGASFRRGRS